MQGRINLGMKNQLERLSAFLLNHGVVSDDYFGYTQISISYFVHKVKDVSIDFRSKL